MNVQEWAQSIVREADNPVVVELGAHHGQDTVQIYDACVKKPLYVAVEADPRNLPVFNLAVGTRDILLVHAAVTNFYGQVVFHQCEGNNDASGSVRRPTGHLEAFPHITFENDIIVPAITLDELGLRFGLSKVDLIWCDIQGAENLMIEGGQGVLGGTRYMVLESDGGQLYEGETTRDGIEALLPSFELVAEWPEDANVLFRRRDLWKS